MEYLVDSYVEQLILFIKTIYTLELSGELKKVSSSYTKQKLLSEDVEKMK